MRVALCSFIYDSFEEEETNRFRVIISDILRQHASCDSDHGLQAWEAEIVIF